MPGRMSIDTLKANLENPARVYLWEVEFIGMPGGAGQFNEYLKTRCQTTVLPGVSNAAIHIPYKGTGGFDVPGRLAFPHTLAMTFVEGEDGAVFAALMRWRQYVADHSEGTAAPDRLLKASVILNMIQKVDANWARCKLFGVWPQDRPDVALNYDTDATVNFSVTFQYDYWKPISL